jgi:hypothetical protein
MSLPSKVIDRLFDRLMATYGREWISKWDGIDISMVKSMWSHELAAYTDNLEAIGWALENLQHRCPNVIEFKQLCKQAPRLSVAALSAPKASADVVDKEIAKIAASAMKAPVDERGQVDHRQWAKKLRDRHQKGEVLSLVQINAYRTALDIREAA